MLSQVGVVASASRPSDLGAKVERVDGHPGVDRTGDLDPSVCEPGRRGGDSPRRVGAYRLGVLEKGQGLTGRQLGRALLPQPKQLLAAALELTVQDAKAYAGS